METKLHCAIVRDLLPSYVDGLASDETRQAIDLHMKDCSSCQEALRLMQEPAPSKIAYTDHTEGIDYLKKVRRHSLRRSFLLGAILLVLTLSVFSYRLFYIGFRTDASDVLCNVSVEGSTLNLTVSMASSSVFISRIVFTEENGTIAAQVFTAPTLRTSPDPFSASYTASSTIQQVSIDGMILWEDGHPISRKTSMLFSTVHPFIGHVSLNHRTASAIGISEHFGPFTNELQTAKEPYGWTIVLEDSLPASGIQAAQEKMIADSCAMLATIQNLGYVTWHYHVGEKMQSFTFSAEDASAFLGESIKTYGNSVTRLQHLMQTLGIR